jgi:hypothetical protein
VVDLELGNRLFLHVDILFEDGTVCEVSRWNQVRPLIRGSELLEFKMGGACIGVQVTSGYDSGETSQGEQGAHIIINYY